MIRWHKTAYRFATAALLCVAFFLSSYNTANAACSNPTGITGEIIYNSSESILQGCKSDNSWQAFHADLRNVYSIAGIVGHWKLDETSGSTIADSAGSNNGTWVDGANNDVAEETINGLIDGAITFNSSSSIIDIPPAVYPATPPYAYTVTGWVRPTRENIVGVGTAAWGGPNLTHGFVFDTVGGGHKGACHHHSTGGGFVRTLPQLSFGGDGQWYLIACTFDGTFLYTYINGVLGGTATESNELDIKTGDWHIGDDNTSGDRFPGDIDDVRMYDRALTASEVNFLYASEACTNNGEIVYNLSSGVFQGCTEGRWAALHYSNLATGGGVCSYGTLGNITTTSDYNATGPISYTVPAGAERLLLVTVLLEGSATYDTTAVTFDGNALTEAAEVTQGTGWSDNLSIWYLPVDSQMGVGAHTGDVVITNTGSPAANLVAVSYLQNVNQTTPISETATANQTGTAISVSYTLANNTMAFDVAGHQLNEAMTPDNGQTKLAEVFSTSESATLALGGMYFSSGSAATLGWSQPTSGRQVMISAELACTSTLPNTCTNPIGVLGEVIYNTTENLYQGCTEFGWQALHN